MGKYIRKRQLPVCFGERLEQAIIKKNVSFNQIERDISVNHSDIVQYIQGFMMPSAYTLYALCTYLNVSSDYLLGLNEG